ncbi:MAG: extracellular solute-binding protein [Prochloron sp. SP5CPC1]|nr:extracellular solute-binding protein [Candidatus Paraprochloron terpiosi SP5CPC1]
MLNRRSFLFGIGTLALSQYIAGCSNSKEKIKILLLKGSIPRQLLKEFRKKLVSSQTPILKPKSQLKDLFALLETWQAPDQNQKLRLPFKKPSMADLITLGDYWLEAAIEKQLIEPLALEALSGWGKLPPMAKHLVTRDGKIWGAPYRWGTTLIAYRRDKLEELGIEPKDWEDLWNSKLRGRISLLNQPREVIGLTLKKLGHSYNTPDLEQIAQLKKELVTLQQQVKFYRSDNYLQPLILGDTWLAVGWSTDILPIQQLYPNIEAVVPRSGTSLWADLWVRPKQLTPDKNKEEKIKEWIDFCWQPDSANLISFYTKAASPMILTMKKEDIVKDVLRNPLLLRDKEILSGSEFLSPLGTDVQNQYRNLWGEMNS